MKDEKKVDSHLPSKPRESPSTLSSEGSIADPESRIKKGFAQIPNDIHDILFNTPFSSNQLRCILFTLKKRYGYNEKVFEISTTYLQQKLDISRMTATKLKKELVDMKILFLVEKGKRDHSPSKYSLNELVQTWELVQISILVKKKKTTSWLNIAKTIPTSTGVGTSTDTNASTSTDTNTHNNTLENNTLEREARPPQELQLRDLQKNQKFIEIQISLLKNRGIEILPEVVVEYLERIIEECGSSGKWDKYQDYGFTIRKWIRQDYGKTTKTYLRQEVEDRSRIANALHKEALARDLKMGNITQEEYLEKVQNNS